MRRIPRILAVLFFVLAAAALWDGAAKVLAAREARFTGQELTEAQFFAIAVNLGFTWLFAAIYIAIGLGFWQGRNLSLVLVLLFACLVGQWMNVGYLNGFILAFVALAALAFPKVRAAFRP